LTWSRYPPSRSSRAMLKHLVRYIYIYTQKVLQLLGLCFLLSQLWIGEWQVSRMTRMRTAGGMGHNLISQDPPILFIIDTLW
jgi:hypothetical protein